MTTLQEALRAAGLVRAKPVLPRVKRRLGRVEYLCERNDKACFASEALAGREADRLEEERGLRPGTLYVYRCVTHRCHHVGGAGGE